MTTETITVSLEACEPMELFRNPTPADLWLRWEDGESWPTASITGPREVVAEFVRDNWGTDVWDEFALNDYGVSLAS